MRNPKTNKHCLAKAYCFSFICFNDDSWELYLIHISCYEIYVCVSGHKLGQLKLKRANRRVTSAAVVHGYRVSGGVEGWRGGGVEGGEAEGERGAGSGLTITDY